METLDRGMGGDDDQMPHLTPLSLYLFGQHQFAIRRHLFHSQTLASYELRLNRQDNFRSWLMLSRRLS